MARVKFRFLQENEYEAVVDLDGWSENEVLAAGPRELEGALFSAMPTDYEGDLVGVTECQVIGESVEVLDSQVLPDNVRSIKAPQHEDEW